MPNNTPNDLPDLPQENRTENVGPAPKTNVGTALEVFMRDMDAVYTSIPIVNALLSLSGTHARKKQRDFLEKNGRLLSSDNGIKSFEISADHMFMARRLARQVQSAQQSSVLVPSSFLVTLVSLYDAHLGRLIRILFLLKPDALNASDQQLTLSLLNRFNSIDEAREYVIEKEIENVLRCSHNEQFEWLEKKFGIQLRNGLTSWPQFIEITERRNLFVHCDGKVSQQYLQICSKHKADIDSSLKLGDQLVVSTKYLKDSYQCIYEIGCKLAHVFWRKLAPDHRADADSNLSDLCYELIHSEQYSLACKLLDFAANLPEHSDDSVRRRFAINRAQAYKWADNEAECNRILSAEDWTACSDDYRLCVSCLKDDWHEAIRIMRRMGKDGPIEMHMYQEWPVFKLFIRTDVFQAAYEEIFGEKFAIVQQEKAQVLTGVATLEITKGVSRHDPLGKQE